MASPQLEKGYLRIATEIIDKLIRYRLSGQEWQVLLVIWRKTYGWNKKEDRIPLSQIAKLTEISRSSAVRAIRKLGTKKILGRYKKVSTNINYYRFNKDFDEWLPRHKIVPTPQGGYQKVTTPRYQKVPTGGVPKSNPQYTTIDTNTINKEKSLKIGKKRNADDEEPEWAKNWKGFSKRFNIADL